MEIRKPSDIKKIFLLKQCVFILIICLCLIAYINSLDNEFVSDDIPGIVQNEGLGNIGLSLKHLNGYQLLKDFLFLCLGRSLFAYHLLNISLHILVTFLVYFFVLVITSRQRLSMFTSFLFALHPIHTEAVSWISGGGYVFLSFFFLLSFIFYHFYLENSKKFLYLLTSLVFYLISLLYSVWALPLPIVFFFYEKYLLGKKINWTFYLILALIIGFYLFSAQGPAGSRISEMAQGTGSAWRNPTITIPHSLSQDIYLLFWPLKLTLYHEGEILTPGYLFWARILTIIVFILLPIILWKKKFFIFFLLFFLLSVSLSLSPVQIASYVAERYLYLGSISFCLLVAFCLLWLEEKLDIKNLAIVLLIPILCFYLVRIVVRNNDWQTPASLWFATAEVSPRSPRVHNNLGDIYGGRGDVENAISEFELARELQPGYADATHNLANTYLQIRELEKAKKYFLEAIEYNPYLYQSYHSLGVISFNQGNREEAKAYFEKALDIYPDYQPSQQAIEFLKDKSND